MGDPARPMSYLDDARLALRAALRCLDWSVPLRAEDAALVREG
jgi:hypothetical protein